MCCARCRAAVSARRCTLGEELVYWWAALVAPEGERDDPRARRGYLLERYRGFAFDIVDALAATDDGSILRHDLSDRPPVRSWSRGAVTLLGDAAHPTTLNLGQGACMAIDDAVLLAELLAARPPAEAFTAYESARIAPTSSIVGLSLSAGKLGQWGAPLAVRARELVYRAFPRAVFDRALEDRLRRSVPRA